MTSRYSVKILLTLFLITQSAEALGMSPLQTVHLGSGQKKSHSSEFQDFLVLSNDCDACQKQVQEISQSCPNVPPKVTFIAVGPRKKILKEFPLIKDQIWLFLGELKELNLKGTPTWIVNGTPRLGFLACSEILKQIRFL